MAESEYDKFKIKVYNNWDLFLHINQFPYLGRAYAWTTRDSAKKLTDLESEEFVELIETVIPEWDNAVRKLFQHDWPNLAIYGNTAPHLHAHLIPRYNSPRNFEGIEFVDKNPKGNYAPYERRELPEKLVLSIRDKMEEAI